MEFTVKLDRFEGPYTKLLELIESRKLSITEISLVDVADDYIAYIKTLDQKNIVDISQFVVVASTLMLMKVKSLLPGVVYTSDEEKQVHDLEYKLELYALLVRAGENIGQRYGKYPLYARAHGTAHLPDVFVPDVRVTTVFLQSIASLTLLSFATPKALTNISVEQALRIEHVIEDLLKRVQGVQSVSLQSVTASVSSKEEQKKLLIVNFIALLELLRTGTISAEQHADGGDITITAQAEKIVTPLADVTGSQNTQGTPSEQEIVEAANVSVLAETAQAVAVTDVQVSVPVETSSSHEGDISQSNTSLPVVNL